MDARAAAAAIGFALSAQCAAMVIDPVDPAFGIAIAEHPKSSNGAWVEMRRIAVGSDGRVAALLLQEQLHADATYCQTLALQVFALNGTLDLSFGNAGRADAAMMGVAPCVMSQGVGFAVAADGAYFVTAVPQSIATPDATPRVWKVTADGHAATGFASGGAPVPGVKVILRPTVQVLVNGGIAIGGTARILGTTEFDALTVVRLRADGTPDAGYGANGVAIAVPPNRPIGFYEGGGMVMQPDGSALVAGNIFEDNAGARIYVDGAVVRFDPQGRLDAAYGTGGFALPLPDASAYVQTLAVRNGEAMVAGIVNRDIKYTFVARIKANGQLDLAFGDGGIAGTDRFYETNFDPQVGVDAQRRVYVKLIDAQGNVRVLRFDSDGRPDPAFGLEGSAVIAAQDWSLGNNGDLAVAPDGRVWVGLGGFPHAQDANRIGIAVTRLTESGGHRDGIKGGRALVYYHAGLDHYFMTADPAEQAKLDNGVTVGWQRTGSEFPVVTSQPLVAELSPVCRYYGRPEAGLDSHFFSAAPDECAAVAQKFPASWLLETAQAFQVHLPDRLTGACPRGSRVVYRAFNGRADANHYYGVQPDAPRGWIYEGYGPPPYPTAFCAPLF